MRYKIKHYLYAHTLKIEKINTKWKWKKKKKWRKIGNVFIYLFFYLFLNYIKICLGLNTIWKNKNLS